MVIKGHDMDVLSEVPMKELNPLFGYGSKPADSIGKTKKRDLIKFHELMQNKSLEIIKNLKNSDFNSELHPTGPSHPIAKTKFEALDWNIKHTMWYCGQIAIIKKQLGESVQFNIEGK